LARPFERARNAPREVGRAKVGIAFSVGSGMIAFAMSKMEKPLFFHILTTLLLISGQRRERRRAPIVQLY
jgi:hypothetical protein